MNTTSHIPAHRPAPRCARVTPPVREPRSRDFGIGYGSSSGYARRAGYAPSTLSARFRVA